MKTRVFVSLLEDFLEQQEALFRLLQEEEKNVFSDQDFWRLLTESLYQRRRFLAQIKEYRPEDLPPEEKERLKLLIRQVIVKDLKLRKQLLEIREKLSQHLKNLHDRGQVLGAYGKNASILVSREG